LTFVRVFEYLEHMANEKSGGDEFDVVSAVIRAGHSTFDAQPFEEMPSVTRRCRRIFAYRGSNHACPVNTTTTHR